MMPMIVRPVTAEDISGQTMNWKTHNLPLISNGYADFFKTL